MNFSIHINSTLNSRRRDRRPMRVWASMELYM